MSPTVAVVGAGVAGAAAADALRRTDLEVTVFERDSDPGGRTATARSGGCVYDTGANYVTDDDPAVVAVLEELDDGGLLEVDSPIWTFDAAGEIRPGDEDRGDGRRWSFETGLATLSRRLVERADARVRTETAVTGLERRDERGERRWCLETSGDAAADATGDGRFDAVVLTPPAPETAALLEASTAPGVDLAAFAEAAAAVPYRSVHSFALHYPFALERPYYALVNTDRNHAVGWLAREAEKRGHVPAGESLLIVQMAPDWSADNRETPLEDAAAAASREAAALLEDDRLAAPDWVDRRRWRHALPDEGAAEAVRTGESAGLFVAGDWVVGEGRVHAALSSGLEVADRLADSVR